MNFTVGQFDIGEPDCPGCKTKVRMCDFLCFSGSFPKPAHMSPAWWFYCLPVSWGLMMGPCGVKDLRRTFISIAG